MSSHIYHTLSQSALEQIETLHTLSQNGFPGPSCLGLVLPEAEISEADTFYALYYIEDTLVSFLSCFCPDGTVCEISGFTDPSFRNRGFFSCLLTEAKKEAGNLFGNVAFHFQCLSSDPDALSFCKTRNLVFSHSECLMEKPWTTPLSAFGVCLLPSSEREILVKLHRTTFDCPFDFSEDYMDTILMNPDTTSYQILSHGKTVGLMHLMFQKAPVPDESATGRKMQTVYLMGLGILPDFRRRGFAEAALQAVFSLLPERSRLLLHVSTSNTAAFRLYEKLGFEVSSRLDYYSLSETAKLHPDILPLDLKTSSG